MALLCKEKPLHVEYGFGIEKYDFEGRVIRAILKTIQLFLYFPSGTTGGTRQDFKMSFLTDFKNTLDY